MANPRKILVIQLKRAGDVVLTTPAAALIKRKWPQARVEFLVEKPFAPLLENNPSIDFIQVYDKPRIWDTWKRLRAQRYDQVFDFQSSPRSAMVVLATGAASTSGYAVPFWGRVYRHTVRRPGSSLTVVQGKISLVAPMLAGPVPDVPPTQIYLTPAEKEWALAVQKMEPGRKVVGIVPTHRRTSRRWHAESFAALARSLEQAGFAVWLFWGPGEREYVAKLQKTVPNAWMIPNTSLRQMAALLARCELVVTNDNGPMHMAVAVGVPTVTVYGPTDPNAWNPGGARHRVLQAAGLKCLGCNLNECPFGHECMVQVTPDQVLGSCRELLGQASKEVLA